MRPHLGWDVVVEVLGVFRIAQFRAVRGGVPMDVLPVDAAEPRMGLQRAEVSNYATAGPLDRTLIRCAPSTLPVAPCGVMKPLRLACTIMEFGLLTDDDA